MALLLPGLRVYVCVCVCVGDCKNLREKYTLTSPQTAHQASTLLEANAHRKALTLVINYVKK